MPTTAKKIDLNLEGFFEDIDERKHVPKCRGCNRHKLDPSESWPRPSRSGYQECPCCYSGEE